MKKIIFLLLLTLIFAAQINFILAEEGVEVTIQNNSILIRGYITSELAGKVDAGYFTKINETFPVTISCENVIVGNETYQKNCILNLVYNKSVPFSINSSHTAIIGDTTLQRKYEDCIQEKVQYSVGLSSCVESKNRMTNYESNFSTCKNNLDLCNLDKSSLTTQKNDLDKKVADTKNLPWIVGAICLAVGAGGMYWYRVKGPKGVKPEDQYNLHQSM